MKITHQASLVVMIIAAWLGSSPWSIADDASDANRTLLERMVSVIVADPLVAEGAATDQQFCDVLQKISDRYFERWKHPLPIRIDFEALQQLRSSTSNLNAFIGLTMRDVPLPETLRDWCSRADLTSTIDHGAALITSERKQTNGGTKK